MKIVIRLKCVSLLQHYLPRFIMSMSEGWYVVKRDGRHEGVHMDKITSRINHLCYGLNMEHVNPILIAKKVVGGLYKGVTTVELDNLAAETAAMMTTMHPDYATLAARIAVSNLHKETKKAFSQVMQSLYDWVNPLTNRHCPMISAEANEIIQKNADRLNSAIVYDRDFKYTYFGFKTLERSYLLKINGKVVERPQHMLMRVAVGIHGSDLDSVLELYDMLSERYFVFERTTLLNAGTPDAQLCSGFVITMASDSIEGIYDTNKQCALTSYSGGSVGFNVHCIRAMGSFIAGTNGVSNGLMPMLRVFNNTARHTGPRILADSKTFTVYLEPWHADILDFLELNKKTGKDDLRARDLNYALWVPDLFMKRVEDDGDWCLMCPSECSALSETYGVEFEKLYMKYENSNMYRKKMKARQLWRTILECQTETGTPHMLYKDACNSKSNQKNLGTIKCSDSCTEIMEFSSRDEVAVCNLASINLSIFVDLSNNNYDFKKLYEVTKVITRNLDRIIDINHYPLPEAERSNKRHRPIGIGVQGLADAFILMRYPFDSQEAIQLNKEIFETIYYAALEASCEMAEKCGTYETYQGSPVSQGILQFDMWNVKPILKTWDWDLLRSKIAKHGVRNSLLLAPMPTASTAQILGNNESFEPYTSNIYTRRVLSGEFQVVNHHLMKDLVDLGLWCDELKNEIIDNRGSVQDIQEIPQNLKDLYKTVWEIKQKVIIDMAADRGAFIDQSQSLNINIADPNYSTLTSMHFYGWKKGLKTGMFYLRTRPAAQAKRLTVDETALIKKLAGSIVINGRASPLVENGHLDSPTDQAISCAIDNGDACTMCSG